MLVEALFYSLFISNTPEEKEGILPVASAVVVGSWLELVGSGWQLLVVLCSNWLSLFVMPYSLICLIYHGDCLDS